MAPASARSTPDDDLHQGALARAVLAEQRVDLAGGRCEVHARERERAAEGLVDPARSRAPRSAATSTTFQIGPSSSLIAGSLMFSLVTSSLPVSMRASTFSPLRCADHGLHREVAHVEGVLQHQAVERAALDAGHQLLGRVEAHEADLAGETRLLEARSMPKVVDSFGVKTPSTLAVGAPSGAQQALARLVSASRWWPRRTGCR